jgi:hypothetical protein
MFVIRSVKVTKRVIILYKYKDKNGSKINKISRLHIFLCTGGRFANIPVIIKIKYANMKSSENGVKKNPCAVY